MIITDCKNLQIILNIRSGNQQTSVYYFVNSLWLSSLYISEGNSYKQLVLITNDAVGYFYIGKFGSNFYHIKIYSVSISQSVKISTKQHVMVNKRNALSLAHVIDMQNILLAHSLEITTLQ